MGDLGESLSRALGDRPCVFALSNALYYIHDADAKGDLVPGEAKFEGSILRGCIHLYAPSPYVILGAWLSHGWPEICYHRRFADRRFADHWRVDGANAISHRLPLSHRAYADSCARHCAQAIPPGALIVALSSQPLCGHRAPGMRLPLGQRRE